MKHYQKLRPKAFLQLIKNIINVNKFFPKNIYALTIKYSAGKKENKINLDYIYATVIFRLYAEIIPISINLTLNIKRQQKASSQFELNYHYTILFFDLNLVKLSSFGPHTNLEKVELKKFSSVNILLKLLQTFIVLSKKK